MKIKNILYFIILCLTISCNTKQQVISEHKEITPSTEILFLNYELIKGMYNQKDIRFINQITTDGKLKEKPKQINHPNNGDLKYTILDKDYQKIESYFIKNPLRKTVEFVNDLGNFEKKIIDLNSVQFSIRIQRPVNAKYITITEVTTPKSIHSLIIELD